MKPRSFPTLLWKAVRGFFSRNIWLKAVALGISLTLFSVVRGAEDELSSVYVNVTASLPTDGMMLISQPPDQVRLTLRGSHSQINSIGDIEPVVMNLTDTAQRYYYFADDDFDIPAGLTITQVAPSSVPLEWARRVERALPVQPRVVREPPEGFVLGEPPRVEPSSIEVSGPEAEVDRLRTIQTEPVELSGLSAGVHEIRVRLMRPPRNTRYADEEVTVTLLVVQDRAERLIAGVEVRADGDAQTTPSRVSVTVEGTPSIVDGIDAADLVASVDTADVDESGTMPVRITGLPNGAVVLVVEPARVSLQP
ncbi:MAG: YbbR domain-containing protein [Polyangiales bacterium]